MSYSLFVLKVPLNTKQTNKQDNAPAHCACETAELLWNETQDFIKPDLWPPDSPDLNPVDYKI